MVILVVLIFPRAIGQQKISKSLLSQIDWPGVLFSLGASILLVVPLEEGGSVYSWKSVIIVMLFVGSGICWIGFGIWETLLTRWESKWKMLPIFPTRLVTHRVIGATIL